MRVGRELVTALALAAILLWFAPHVEPAKTRDVKVHDIIMLTVKEAAQTDAKPIADRQPTAPSPRSVRLESPGGFRKSAPSSPEIGNELQPTGLGTESESTTYHIAATVVDSLPNGVLVLEAHKSWLENKTRWEYTLTGKIRPQDITADHCASSEQIADLCIAKVRHGKPHDSTNPAWFVQLYNLLGLL